MFKGFSLVNTATGEEIMKGEEFLVTSEIIKEEITPKKYRVEIKDEEGNTYTVSTDKLELDGKNLYTDFAVFEDVKLKSVDTVKGE